MCFNEKAAFSITKSHNIFELAQGYNCCSRLAQVAW